MSEELRVGSSDCTKFNTDLGNCLTDFTDTVNKIASISDTISESWSGIKNKNYMKQLNEFLPNLTIGYNIIEKAQNEVATFVSNDHKADG